MALTLHVGIDDTDSMQGGCTTYVAALLVERLSRLGVEFLDYPNLVRLNPNIPWKTRGNGAIALRIKVEPRLVDRVRSEVLRTVEENSQLGIEYVDPAVVFLTGPVPEEVKALSRRALYDIVDVGYALEVAGRCGVEVFAYGDFRGVVGAMAAVGEELTGDHTYELLTYRVVEYRGKPRMVSEESVAEMDRATRPRTFDNLDPETGRVLITPRGPDPVLYGIRGEDPYTLLEAMKIVKVGEPIERWVIFRSNQGTDSHLRWIDEPGEVKPYRAVAFRAVVYSKPYTIPGGHVIFRVSFKGEVFDCAAYEPTGGFRDIARKLIPGDVVEVYGGVRPLDNGLTVNLEKLRIVELAKKVEYRNPKCPKCLSTMKSMGRGKGFRCRKCGFRDPKARKLEVELPRDVKPGLYIPPPRAHRHLTKPYSRYGQEKKGMNYGFVEPWHMP